MSATVTHARGASAGAVSKLYSHCFVRMNARSSFGPTSFVRSSWSMALLYSITAPALMPMGSNSLISVPVLMATVTSAFSWFCCPTDHQRCRLGGASGLIGLPPDCARFAASACRRPLSANRWGPLDRNHPWIASGEDFWTGCGIFSEQELTTHEACRILARFCVVVVSEPLVQRMASAVAAALGDRAPACSLVSMSK